MAIMIPLVLFKKFEDHNNRFTALEQTAVPANGDLNTIYCTGQTFTLDSAVFKAHTWFIWHWGFLTYSMNQHRNVQLKLINCDKTICYMTWKNPVSWLAQFDFIYLYVYLETGLNRSIS